MQNLDDFFKTVGSEAKTVLDRLGGSEMLVRKFLGKFKDDKSFSELTAALEAGDIDTAFRAAHTMKGVCANLGLDSLFKLSSEVTEILRPKAEGAIEEAKKKMPELKKEYERVLEELKKLAEN